MRKIKYIVLHCTATDPHTPHESILRYWKRELGWKSPGYHYLIQADGTVLKLLPEEEVANGVKNYNSESIHISYIGGVDNHGQPRDTRTLEQQASQIGLLKILMKKYPKAIVQGHRDFPGVTKACPSFDVKKWLEQVGILGEKAGDDLKK